MAKQRCLYGKTKQFIWQNKDEEEKRKDKQTEVSAKVVRSIKGQDQFKKEER